MNLNVLFVLGVLMGMYSLVSKRRHILMSLMSLEFVSMIIFLGLVFNYGFGNYDSYISIYYLVFSACESAFGLGVIVLIVRSLGNDMFGNMSII